MIVMTRPSHSRLSRPASSSPVLSTTSRIPKATIHRTRSGGLFPMRMDVEKLERYSAGGYHPVMIGDRLQGYDAFKIDGPNGTHSCYAMVLAAQLVVAVEYLHSQGYAHDDFHHGNVLTRMPSEFSYSQCGQPELIPITRFKGKDLSPDISSHAIVPVWLGKAMKFESRPPLVYRAPEARFESGTTPLSYPSDIWSPLFEGFLAREDDITCEHVDALGSLPPEWWSKWKVRQTRFNEDGKPLDWRSYRSWEGRYEDSVQRPRRVEGMSMFEPAERDALLSMLRSMLSFRPESRSLAREVFASEWMISESESSVC
ncbi:hypothetical protein BDW71DRAFT_199660 [Aspergillus fruticulosus]